MTVFRIQDALDFLKILRAAYERVGYEINVGLYRPLYETPVFFRYGRKIDVDIRDIDTLVTFDQPLVHHLTNQFSLVLVGYGQFYGAVIYKNVGTYRYVFSHVRVGSIQYTFPAQAGRIVDDFHRFSGACHESYGVGHLCQSDFRTFRIYKYSYLV